MSIQLYQYGKKALSRGVEADRGCGKSQYSLVLVSLCVNMQRFFFYCIRYSGIFKRRDTFRMKRGNFLNLYFVKWFSFLHASKPFRRNFLSSLYASDILINILCSWLSENTFWKLVFCNVRMRITAFRRRGYNFMIFF